MSVDFSPGYFEAVLLLRIAFWCGALFLVYRFVRAYENLNASRKKVRRLDVEVSRMQDALVNVETRMAAVEAVAQFDTDLLLNRATGVSRGPELMARSRASQR